MADYFISYTATDRGWAEWIAWVLEEKKKCTAALQAWDFVPGSNFVLEMQRAAASASRTIAVLSPDYLRSAYAQSEWAAAFAQDPEGMKRKLVPVMVKDCILDGLLKPIVHRQSRHQYHPGSHHSLFTLRLACSWRRRVTRYWRLGVASPS